jgi:hypothetical protein
MAYHEYVVVFSNQFSELCLRYEQFVEYRIEDRIECFDVDRHIGFSQDVFQVLVRINKSFQLLWERLRLMVQQDVVFGITPANNEEILGFRNVEYTNVFLDLIRYKPSEYFYQFAFSDIRRKYIHAGIIPNKTVLTFVNERQKASFKNMLEVKKMKLRRSHVS